MDGCGVVVAVGFECQMAAKHRGNTTDGDEVVAKYTHALSLCVVCPGQRQSFLELSVILKKQKWKRGNQKILHNPVTYYSN